jgi:hypothetical protein
MAATEKIESSTSRVCLLQLKEQVEFAFRPCMRSGDLNDGILETGSSRTVKKFKVSAFGGNSLEGTS